jgi:hypothetical protein
MHAIAHDSSREELPQDRVPSQALPWGGFGLPSPAAFLRMRWRMLEKTPRTWSTFAACARSRRSELGMRTSRSISRILFPVSMRLGEIPTNARPTRPFTR